jgi:exonuclease VII large subunit
MSDKQTPTPKEALKEAKKKLASAEKNLAARNENYEAAIAAGSDEAKLKTLESGIRGAETLVENRTAKVESLKAEIRRERREKLFSKKTLKRAAVGTAGALGAAALVVGGWLIYRKQTGNTEDGTDKV